MKVKVTFQSGSNANVTLALRGFVIKQYIEKMKGEQENAENKTN